ncbi:hypothetical protein QWJ34_22535 [Saccharibacillus sp. CPCC 101409]|uniref:hypothetical protein n=1 Tax=Saccharibacillus sp. CPCC 101409 TaxID=3058041 RepID=UPI002671CB04|nr:hypothetical protein [Saccharibacillus sp. CPCC 101409]MDO3412560.1 hypothetical protein [Saccharibacillus sp. CPCC 101409]
MHRAVYRAWSPDAEAAERYFRRLRENEADLRALRLGMDKESVRLLGAFGGNGHWFVYLEKEARPPRPGSSAEPGRSPAPGGGEDVEADAALRRLLPGARDVLAAWPGASEPKVFAPMTDIFHYQRPHGREHWRRKAPAEAYGRIARLKPDMTASYVYYHHQYQEEKPGDGNKYGVIGLHENLLFFYAERPAVLEPAPYAGTLNTSNTPEDWGAAMRPHFIEWADMPESERVWLNLDRVLEVRLPDQTESGKDE